MTGEMGDSMWGDAATSMRDLYANEIARAVHAGATPDPFAVQAWARYDEETKITPPGKGTPR